MSEHNWKKTDHIEPHEYIYVWEDPELAVAINASKIIEEFRGRRWRYLYREGFKFWIAYPCINRCRVKVE